MRQRGGERRRWDTRAREGEQRSGNYNGESSERVLQTPSPISRQFSSTESSKANKGENGMGGTGSRRRSGRKEYSSPLKNWEETSIKLLKELFKARKS